MPTGYWFQFIRTSTFPLTSAGQSRFFTGIPSRRDRKAVVYQQRAHQDSGFIAGHTYIQSVEIFWDELLQVATNFTRPKYSADGGFSVDTALLTLPMGTVGNRRSAGLLLLKMNVQFCPPVTGLLGLDSSNVYFVGRPNSGIISVARTIGLREVAGEFHQKYADVCRGSGNRLRFSFDNRCNDDPAQCVSAEYTAHGVIVTHAGFSIASRNVVIIEQLQMRFSDFAAI